MTAHVPIPPRKATDLAGSAQIEDTVRVLADFAEAGLVKGYARLQETLYSDGRTEEVRDARMPRKTWRRIIAEGKVAEVASGTVRLSGSPELGGGPKMNIFGIRFDEESVIAMIGQHGVGPDDDTPPPSSTPPSDPTPPGSGPMSGSPAAASAAVMDDPTVSVPRAAPTPRSKALSPDARALTIDQAAVALSLGRTKLYDMIKDQEIEMTKIGRRSVISRDEIDRILGKSKS